MSHPRLYSPQALFPDAAFQLRGNPAHYVTNVLRMGPGGEVRLFNGGDGEWGARILRVHKKFVDLRVEARLREPEPLTLSLALLFSPLKPHRLELLIEKATELGVTNLIPCQTDHTHRRPINWQRMAAIAIEATEQSGRLRPPVFHALDTLTAQLAAWPAQTPLFWGDLDQQTVCLNTLVSLCGDSFCGASFCASSTPQVGLLIGPEGGWSLKEKERLRADPRLTPLSLGPTTLRAETAAFLGLGLLQLAALTAQSNRLKAS